MATKQIHELQPVAIAAGGDRIVVSTAQGNVTRQTELQNIAARMPGSGAVDRRIQSKLADAVSVRDFGAVGDGTTDDAPAFAAALAAHRSLFVPAGRYRLATAVDVPPGRTILGAGRDDVEIVAQALRAFVFRRNEGTLAIQPNGTDDWCRSMLARLSIRMTAGGIEVWGHEFRLSDVNFYGGSASGWCVDLIDSNECVIEKVSGGYGGSMFRLFAGGIRFKAAKPNVNYGDSLISEVSLKLGSTSTIGILLDGSTASATNWINNMILQRVQVNAPVNGSGTTALAGTVGIKLTNAARINLIDCDVEVSETGFEEYSQSVGGTAGACVGNNFIGCITHYCPTPYKDSNTAFDRSVIQRTFLGCDNMAPLDTRLEAALGRCQDGDAFFTGTWLFNRHSQPSIQFRSSQKNVLLVTGDNKGALQTKADGHATQETPYRGLLVDIGSKNAAKLTRPISIGAIDPDNGDPMLDVRLELGNGQDDARGELARVQINDPLYLAPRTSEPTRGIDGLIHHAAEPSALPAFGEYYLGAGLYCRLNGGEYSPVAVPRGAVAEREVNVDRTLSAIDFGKVLRVANGSARTITIPGGLVAPGEGARRLWVIRQGSGDVFFVGTNGANLRLPRPGRNWIERQYQMVEIAIFPDNQVYLHHLDPDVDKTFVHPTQLSNLGYPDGIPAFHMGKLIHVSHGGADAKVVKFGTGLVPAGSQAAWVKLVKAGTSDIQIVAGDGMTLRAPGGGTSYLISEINKMVEVTVTAADAPAGIANTVYVRA
jgi:hypothetical protein